MFCTSVFCACRFIYTVPAVTRKTWCQKGVYVTKVTRKGADRQTTGGVWYLRMPWLVFSHSLFHVFPLGYHDKRSTSVVLYSRLLLLLDVRLQISKSIEWCSKTARPLASAGWKLCAVYSLDDINHKSGCIVLAGCAPCELWCKLFSDRRY